MVLGLEDWPCASLIGGRTPRALGASTQRAVRRKKRSLNARPVLAGCSATKAERAASVSGEHAVGIRDERAASEGRGRSPSAIGPKNLLKDVSSSSCRWRTILTDSRCLRHPTQASLTGTSCPQFQGRHTLSSRFIDRSLGGNFRSELPYRRRFLKCHASRCYKDIRPDHRHQYQGVIVKLSVNDEGTMSNPLAFVLLLYAQIKESRRADSNR
jgi:hypothetical protein